MREDPNHPIEDMVESAAIALIQRRCVEAQRLKISEYVTHIVRIRLTKLIVDEQSSEGIVSSCQLAELRIGAKSIQALAFGV